MLVKTVQQAHDRLVSLADINGQTTGTNPRHVEADNILMLNDTYRSVREHFTVNGFREFITPSATLTGPAAAETGETYGVVDFPVTATSLQGFDVLYDGRWYSLEEVDWEERRSFQVTSARRPEYYSLRTFGTVVTTAEAVGKIAFFPFVPSISYRIQTLDEWQDITTTTHKFIYPSQAAYDFHIYGTAWKIVALRDGDKSQRANWLAEGVRSAKETIGVFVSKVTQTGPKTIRRDRNYRSTRGY